MDEGNRLATVVLEVADLDRSVQLYREGFGLDLHVTDHRGADHGEDDRWISGRHAATTWTEGAFLHFALYESKGERTSGAQRCSTIRDLSPGARALAIATSTATWWN